MNEVLLNNIAATAYSFKETVINTYHLAKTVLDKKIPGVMIECGVGAGAQIAAMQSANMDCGESRPVIAYDSFEGIPLAGPEDGQQPGIGNPQHDVNKPLRERLVSSGITSHSIDNVQKNIISFGMPVENIKFVKGWFQDTLPQNDIGYISILRLDGDLYESTMVCLEHLFPKVVKGGFVIIDDYALDGARKAFDEYVSKNKIEALLVKVAPEGNGVVWFEKMNDAVELPKVMEPPKNYSQNNEQEIIVNYFGGRKGLLLDIGANDGITFSNSHQLMNEGWRSILIEPSPKAFERLSKLYEGNRLATCMQIGIGKETGEVEFWESGAFNHTGPDVSLVSCVDPKEKDRWGASVAFEPIKVKMVSFKDFIKDSIHLPPYNFISIDAEGMDYEILKQINLNEVGCECFCIEHNSVPDMINKYRAVADYFGFKEIGFNAENLIFGK